MLKILYTKLKKILLIFEEYRKIHKRQIFVSFGENCLTDNILKRYGIKSFSTPYSSSRSNIEYILQIEKDKFKHFLNPNFLTYDCVDNKRVVRLTTYDKLDNKYNDYHMKGFEFTHHDVLGDFETRKKLQHRAKRMLKLKNKEINIFYHNRQNIDTNESMLIEHLIELKKIYETRCQKVNIIMFTQIKVDNVAERRVEHSATDGIDVFKFYVLNIWAGEDQDIFWARCDDDLIKKMIDYCTS